MTKNVIHILSTKVLGKAILEDAASKNIIIDCIPFIETKAITDIHISLTEVVGSAIVFTSKQAVKAVAGFSNIMSDAAIFCISGATKNTVEKYFPQSNIKDTAADAKGLAEKIVTHKEVSSVTFFCGNKRLSTLPAILKQNGMNVNEIVVYETLLTPHKIENNYDGIAFFSPSAVQSFFSVNKPDENMVAFAIGKTTAEALQLFTNNIVQPDFPDQKSMLEKINKYFLDNVY
jgi:uroporphyrinogen-III synthase